MPLSNLESASSTASFGGSLIAGVATGTGDLTRSGYILALSIGMLTIKGSILGNQTNPAVITFFGKNATESGFAVGSLTVGAGVEWAIIESFLPGGGHNVQIGTVTIGGDWIASSLASGVRPVDANYGNGDDVLTTDISRIASISIGGAIIGTDSADSFGFTAHEIGAFTALGKTFPRIAGAVDPEVTFSLETGGDVKLREL